MIKGTRTEPKNLETVEKEREQHFRRKEKQQFFKQILEQKKRNNNGSTSGNNSGTTNFNVNINTRNNKNRNIPCSRRHKIRTQKSLYSNNIANQTKNKTNRANKRNR